MVWLQGVKTNILPRFPLNLKLEILFGKLLQYVRNDKWFLNFLIYVKSIKIDQFYLNNVF